MELLTNEIAAAGDRTGIRVNEVTKIHFTLLKTQLSNLAMNRNILFVFGILTLLTIAVFLTDSSKSRVRFHDRRFLRSRWRLRPTAKPTRRYRTPLRQAQNNQHSDSPPIFTDQEDVRKYYDDIYENGDLSYPEDTRSAERTLLR